MKIANIFFSPTGGTRKVADIVASGLGDIVSNVDLCNRNKTALLDESAELAVISAPVYNGRISETVVDRILALRGRSIPCVIVVVYGNRAYDNALAELDNTVGKVGLQVVAAVAAVAEHSIMHQFATGRPTADDAAVLRGFTQQILKKISAGDMSKPSLPGHVPTKPAKEGLLIPKPGKECYACGMCALKCPTGAIDECNPRAVDEDKCISCMRCVGVCPKQGRRENPWLIRLIVLLKKKEFATPKVNGIWL